MPLVTERLTIRRFEPRDVESYLQFMLDEESTRYITFEAEQKTEAGAKGLFEYVTQHYDTPEAVHAYAIADRATDGYVGSCGFAPYAEGVVECYYCVNPEHRGRGFAAEAATALIQVLAEIAEVRAYCHPDNTAAHAVARRCGMSHAGHTRHEHSGLEGELFVYAVHD